jgi:hypothetical protein
MHQYADIYLLQRQTDASSWSFLLILNYDARNHELKKKYYIL